MLDILYLLTQTKPIEILSPQIAQAYYEVPAEVPIDHKIDPIASNCYAYVSQFVKLPPTRDIMPNTTPKVGVVVLMQYKVPHYALVKSLQEDGFVVKESNYVSNTIGERFIPWNDPHITGFFYPTSH